VVLFLGMVLVVLGMVLVTLPTLISFSKLAWEMDPVSGTTVISRAHPERLISGEFTE
jgi:hypothetical protein